MGERGGSEDLPFVPSICESSQFSLNFGLTIRVQTVNVGRETQGGGKLGGIV
jgi:hypothetical protein